MREQFNLFIESTQQFLNEIAVAIPKIIGAMIILLVGWIIARLLKRLFVKFLYLVRFNLITEKSGVDKFLNEGGVKSNAVEVLGTLFYWIIMLIVIMATLNSLNLTAASELFHEIMLYIPNIIVALAILIIGIYLAKMISQMLKTSLTSMQDKTSALIGQIAYIAIIILTVFVTLGQLNIASTIVSSAFQIVFGAICLALALAFGLGGREKASKFLDELFDKKKKL